MYEKTDISLLIFPLCSFSTKWNKCFSDNYQKEKGWQIDHSLLSTSFHYLSCVNGWVYGKVIVVVVLRVSVQDNYSLYIRLDDVLKFRHFSRYCPFVRGIHRSPVNYLHKGPWRGALMFSLVYVRVNGWVNNCDAGDLRCHRAHYDVNVTNRGINKQCRSVSCEIFTGLAIHYISPTMFH